MIADAPSAALLLALAFSLNVVGWLVVRARNRHHIAHAPRLGPDDAAAAREPAPRVSILVPARNEADRLLARAVGSMLRQDWPNLEVVAVDDRSTDATGEILRTLAAEHPRLVVVSGVEPPPGWMGKTHALHQALSAASGEWVLATDADMVFHPSAVRAAMTAAARQAAAMVTLIPDGGKTTPAVDLVMPVAVWMILWTFPPQATNDPDDPRALGVGGFLLVRRDALESVGGYEAIAGDVADDVSTAEALKAAGWRLHCALAPELLYTPMYESLRELYDGFSKNAFRGVDGSVPQALAASTLLLTTGVLPALAAVALAPLAADPGWRLAWLAAVASTASHVAAFAPVYRGYGVPAWYALATPWGFAVMLAVLLNATWRAVTGRGVTWRGRVVGSSGSKERS